MNFAAHLNGASTRMCGLDPDTLNASISRMSDRAGWTLKVHDRDLANEQYAAAIHAQENNDLIQYAAARTYGVSAGYEL